MAKIIKAGQEIGLPPLHDWEGAEELAAALMMAGPSEPGAMGDIPLSWATLAAWADLTETHLTPGDYEALRELSGEWVAACDEFREKLVPAPYGVLRATDPATEAKRIAALFDGLIAQQNKKKGGG